jgi:hypothetical protein
MAMLSWKQVILQFLIALNSRAFRSLMFAVMQKGFGTRRIMMEENATYKQNIFLMDYEEI